MKKEEAEETEAAITTTPKKSGKKQLTKEEAKNRRIDPELGIDIDALEKEAVEAYEGDDVEEETGDDAVDGETQHAEKSDDKRFVNSCCYAAVLC